MGKKVLIAGAGGYIGITMVREFLEAGYQVTGLDRYYFGKELLGPEILNHKNFKLLKKDIRSVTATDFLGIDSVIDLAGLSNDPTCDLDLKLTYDINHLGCVNVAKCAKEAGVSRYVFSSSCSVYGEGQSTILTEESPLLPVSAYAKAKIEAEKQLLALADSKFCVTLLRNATVYGFAPRMRFDLIINIMTLFAWRDKRVFIMGGGKQWRPLVHVKDVVRAFKLVLESEPSLVQKECYNVGSNNQNYQVIQVANLVKEIFPETNLVIAPDDNDKRSYRVCFDKIEKSLGFKNTKTPQDGINEIKAALDGARVDPTDPRTVTLKYYQYLLNAEKLVREVAIDGKIF